MGEYTGNVAYGKEHIYVGAQLVATVKENEPPVANAGADRVVAAGTMVTLQGSGSDADGSITAYQWAQTAGTHVMIFNANTATPTFAAPSVGGETLVFAVTVTDDQGATATDSVNVVINQPPVANAGIDQTVYGQQLVMLNGTASTDGEGAITYSWQQIAGPTVSLTGATTATPSFTAPEVSTDTVLGFSLTVRDELGLTSTDTVNVTVLSMNTDQDGDGLADMWEMRYFGNLTPNPADDTDGDGLTNLQEFTEGTDPTVPAAAPLPVSDMQATPGDGQNVIGWSNAVSVLRYDIYWSTTPGAENGTLISGVTSPYVHTGLTNDTSYYYRVVAVNNAGTALSEEVSAKPGTRAWSGARLLDDQPTGVSDVAMDAAGNGWAVRLLSDGVRANVWAQRFVAGSGWQVPVLIEQSTQTAEQPQIAVDSKGNAVATWIESGSLWANRFDTATGWGTPQLLESITYYIVRTPDLAMSDDGNAVVVWTQNERIYANYFGRDTGWSGHMLIDLADAQWSENPKVAMDAAGNAIAVWSRSITSGRKIYANRYVAGQAWGAPTSIETQYASNYCWNPKIAMNADGKAFVVWRHYISGVYQDHTQSNRYDPATGWASYQTLSDSTASMDVGVDDLGNALASWVVGGTEYSLMVARYTPATGWGIPATHTTSASLISHSLAMNGAGDAVLLAGMSASFSIAGGSWSPAVLLKTGDAPATVFGIALNDHGDFLVPWSETEAGVTRAWMNLYAVRGGDFPPNSAPMAYAGPDQSVVQGTTVTLSGSGTDTDGTLIGYAWKQIEGPAVTLAAPGAATTTFTAPTVKKATNLVFQLTVLDNIGGRGTDLVTVTVAPR